jgi:hypothetical protein
MQGATIKTVSAQQARLNNSYKNTKLKLLKTNAAIRFNKICRDRQLKPNYIFIKINGTKCFTDYFNILHTSARNYVCSLMMVDRSKHVGAF